MQTDTQKVLTGTERGERERERERLSPEWFRQTANAGRRKI